MRIIYVERNLARDSIVFDQIRRLARRVSTRTIAVQVGGFPMLDDSEVISAPCRLFPKVERVKSRLFVHAARKACRALAERESFELVHAHFAYPDGLAALAIAGELGVPYVITGRGDDVLAYPGESRYLDGCVREVLRGCSAFIGVSLHVCEAAARLGAKEAMCFHVPDGIPEDIFRPCVGPESGGGVRGRAVLFAGLFLPVKNVLTMIRAFAIVSRRLPDIRFEFAGEGPLRCRMEKALAAEGIAESSRFLGFLSPEALAGKMRGAAVLCLPSIREAWGNVIAESLACGTPVVGSNVGGIPEQIVSEDYGLLYDPLSPEDIAEKVVSALERGWDHEKIAERGRLHTRDDAARRIVEVYESVLNRCAESQQ